VRLRKQHPSPAPPRKEATTQPSKPEWQARLDEHLDSQERPNRDDRCADHDVFLDSILEPVDMPRWLRGRRRPRQDKLSGNS
jgi:hypothetical protein